MRVAVTGSTGLVGTELVKLLRQKRIDVLECTRENCDVTNKGDVEKALRGADVVVHCAAELDEKSPKLFDVNVKGTENVLEACEKNRVKHFIFLSSVGVYGASKGMLTEKSPANPVTDYERSKLEAEKKVLSCQEVFPITILRPAIIIGANIYWKKIIGLIRKNYPLIGSGRNKWQTVSKGDVAGAVVFCMNNSECYGETFNVAEKDAITLRELVEFVREKSGLKGRLLSVPVWLANILAHINSVIKVVPMLDTDYIKRLNRERFYSTKKLEALGWRAKDNAKKCLEELLENSA